MKKLEYIVHGVKFTISTDSDILYEEQQQELAKDIRPNDVNAPYEENIEIFYTKNNDLFNAMLKQFQFQKLETFNTFIREQHFKGKINGNTAFQRQNQEYFLVKGDNENCFTLVGNPQLDTSIFLSRLIREMLIQKLEVRNTILTHANGLVLNGTGILVTNKSGGGKTTLTQKLFESGEWVGFLSNDKVFSSIKDGQAIMRYYPCAMVYSMGTIKGAKRIGDHFRKHHLVEQATFNEYNLDSIPPKHKIEFPTSELPTVYPNVQLLKRFNVNRLLIPKIDLTAGSDYVNVSRISPNEAENILKANTLTPNDRDQGRNPWIYSRKKSESALISMAKTVNNVLLKHPAYLVEYGLDASPEDILSKLS